jgi:hypothetical protein
MNKLNFFQLLIEIFQAKNKKKTFQISFKCNFQFIKQYHFEL